MKECHKAYQRHLRFDLKKIIWYSFDFFCQIDRYSTEFFFLKIGPGRGYVADSNRLSSKMNLPLWTKNCLVLGWKVLSHVFTIAHEARLH